MTPTRNHYEKILAGHYTWMSGGRRINHEKNTVFFRDAGIRAKPGSHAVDLGCGPGFHAIPLAHMGFSVTGIDQSAKLLEELAGEKGDLPIRTIQDDLMNFDRHSPGGSDLILCMGDTLTHLDSRETVTRLFEKCYARLKPEGCFIITYRDLSDELIDLDRFIPVRNNENVILTCFLEYEEMRIKVHDLLYERRNKEWTFKKSSYYKLRLPLAWVTRQLEANGFEPAVSRAWNGMAVVIATKLH